MARLYLIFHVLLRLTQLSVQVFKVYSFVCECGKTHSARTHYLVDFVCSFAQVTRTCAVVCAPSTRSQTLGCTRTLLMTKITSRGTLEGEAIL